MMKNCVIFILVILTFFNVLAMPCYAEAEEEPEEPGFFDIQGKFEKCIRDFCNNLANDFLNTAREFLQETLFQEKDLTQKKELITIWQRNVKMSFGLLLVLFMIGVSSATLRELLDLNLLTLREVGLKTIFAIIFVYFSLDAASMTLSLSNGITCWILDDPYKNISIFNQSEELYALSAIILALIFAVLSLILAIVYAIRDCVLWYIIAYSPFFIVLWVLPQTEKYARYAANIFLGMVLLKFIHAGLLNIFMKIQSEGSANDIIMSIGFLTLMFVIPSAILGLAQMINSSGRVLNSSSKTIKVFSKKGK